MVEQTVHILRWYDEEMSPIAFPDLFQSVAEVTDLDMRRHNNHIGNAVHDVQSKLEIIGYHAKMALDRLPWCKTFIPLLLEKLADERKNTPIRVIRNALRVDRRIEFYDYIFVAHLEGILIQSKSLLDSLTQFYSLTFGRRIKVFESRGRKMLRDISSLPDNLETYRNSLRNIIKDAKELWIDEVIDYRDQVAHHGQLPGFHCPMLKLTDSLNYSTEDIASACMPNGRHAEDLINLVLNQSHQFSKEMLKVFFERLREQETSPS